MKRTSHEEHEKSSSSLPDLITRSIEPDNSRNPIKERVVNVSSLLRDDGTDQKDYKATIVAPLSVVDSDSNLALNVVFAHDSSNSPEPVVPNGLANPISSRGGTPVLLSQIESLSNFLSTVPKPDSASIVDWMSKSSMDLLDELDWIFHSPPSQQMTISGSDEDGVGIGGRPIYVSPSRTEALARLVPLRYYDLIAALVVGNWEGALQALAKNDSVSDPLLMKSLVRMNMQLSNATLVCGELKILQDLVSCVSIFPTRRNLYTEKSVSPFIRMFFAINYLESPHETIADIVAEGSSSLRVIVVHGLNDTLNLENLIKKHLHAQSLNPFAVALLGLFLKTSNPLADQCIDFVRQTCNRLRGNAWLLRDLIDRIAEKKIAPCIMTCYYCGKPLIVPPGEVTVRCPHRGCHRALPCCSICLEPVALGNKRGAATVWCSTCRHGGHKGHVLDWFGKFDDCPVAGCHCQCSSIDVRRNRWIEKCVTLPMFGGKQDEQWKQFTQSMLQADNEIEKESMDALNGVLKKIAEKNVTLDSFWGPFFEAKIHAKIATEKVPIPQLIDTIAICNRVEYRSEAVLEKLISALLLNETIWVVSCADFVQIAAVVADSQVDHNKLFTEIATRVVEEVSEFSVEQIVSLMTSFSKIRFSHQIFFNTCMHKIVSQFSEIDLDLKIQVARVCSKAKIRSDTFFKQVCSEKLNGVQAAEICVAMRKLKMHAGSTKWWDKERDYARLVDLALTSTTPEMVASMSASQLATITALGPKNTSKQVLGRVKDLLTNSPMSKTHKELANILANLSAHRERKLMDQVRWIAEWLCSNVYILPVADIASINRSIAKLGFKDHNYHKIWVAYYLERLDELTKDDISSITDNYNAIGMSDTLLGGRHFFYKLGKRFQELTVEKGGDKDMNTNMKYRNLLTRLG